MSLHHPRKNLYINLNHVSHIFIQEWRHAKKVNYEVNFMSENENLRVCDKMFNTHEEATTFIENLIKGQHEIKTIE